MSAICGMFRFDGGPVSRDAIGGMLEALRLFGEEPSTWSPESPEIPVALGCRPRRVTPEDAHYRPPVHSADGRLVLVADARIDNRAELGPALGISHREAAQLSDAAFILAAFQAWESDAPRHLIGDYVFALWDQRHRRLFCARDGMGLRVLYYHVSAQRIAFATAPFALAALSDVPTRLNEQKVAETLVLYQDPESTFFTGVKRLLPGHTLTASREGVSTQRFWAPAPAPTSRRSDREFVDGFIDVFDRAVSARIRSDGPVGVLLSGGLDSTSVAASAAAQMNNEGRRLQAFHAAPRIGFGAGERPGWTADESAEVEAVAGCHPNIDLWIHRTGSETPFDSDFTLFQMAGLPPRNPNNLTWFAANYAAAQARQVRVLLNGNQGNNTISYDGIQSLRDMARRGHWVYVLREVRRLARATGRGSRRVLRQQVLLPLVPAWLSPGRRDRHPLEQARHDIATYSAIHPHFVSATRVDERVAADGYDSIRARRAGGVAHRIAGLQSPADSPDLANGCRAWFGIETREPATDQRVIEYCLSVPPSQYLRDGESRWLIRRAMRGRLPEAVLDRTARGSQAADWTEWFPRMRGQIGAELDRLERSDTARRCLDLVRLRLLMANFPEPLRLEHRRTYVHLVLRGVTMGRFIRWFETTYGQA